MKCLWMLILLSIVEFCGGCAGCNDLDRTRQWATLDGVAFQGMSEPQRLAIENEAATAGGYVKDGTNYVHYPYSDQRTIELLDRSRGDPSPQERALRAILIRNLDRQGSYSETMRSSLEIELATSERAFINQPADLLEYLVWGTLARKLNGVESAERVSEAAVASEPMTDTMRRDAALLRWTCAVLAANGHADLAARIDWPTEIKERAEAQDRAEQMIEIPGNILRLPFRVLGGNW